MLGCCFTLSAVLLPQRLLRQWRVLRVPPCGQHTEGLSPKLSLSNTFFLNLKICKSMVIGPCLLCPGQWGSLSVVPSSWAVTPFTQSLLFPRYPSRGGEVGGLQPGAGNSIDSHVSGKNTGPELALPASWVPINRKLGQKA